MRYPIAAAVVLALAAGPLRLVAAPLIVEPAFPNLRFQFPVDLQNAGDGTNRLFVAEMPGVIRVFEGRADADSAGVFLDIRDRVVWTDRFGLLGFAFHPDYETNGWFFVNYVAPDPARTVIARYQVSAADANVAERGSETILLEVEQPDRAHNGGQLAFGPDGRLYIGLGDGGYIDALPDRDNHGQRRDTYLGAMLRLDVNGSSSGRAYAIPADNPFVGNQEGWLEEIWAWGFRNPWRYSFDPVTGWLWAADNGENNWEEINLVEKGKNYGWRVMEGNECFLEACDPSQFAAPLFVYGGTEQRRSVIGGHVYRGQANPELVGKYVYADYLRGLIWALEYDGTGEPRNEELQSLQFGISCFGLDEQKELYFCKIEAGRIDHFRPTRTPVKPLSLSRLKGRYR